jgi:hypothetical protein
MPKTTKWAELKKLYKLARKQFIALVKYYKETGGSGKSDLQGSEAELKSQMKELHSLWQHFEKVWPAFILGSGNNTSEEQDVLATKKKMEKIEKEMDKHLGSVEPWKGYFKTMNKFCLPDNDT